jgi:bacterioferritin-associated ferredoxin
MTWGGDLGLDKVRDFDKLRITFNFNDAVAGRVESTSGCQGRKPMILCQCKGISDTTIQKLISDGASTVKAIAKSCGAGKMCKPCASEIASMLNRASITAGQETRCAA